MKQIINFMGARVPFLVLSVALIIGGLAGTVVQGGFNLGIDFQAGLSMQVQVNPAVRQATAADVRGALSAIEGVAVTTVGDVADQQFVVRVSDRGTLADFEAVMSERILTTLGAQFGAGAVIEQEVAYVGPRFSRDLTQQAVYLVVFSLSLILIYLWFRFRLAYAVASIVALLHDVLMMVGIIGTLQLEVTSATIAAVLTIIGYSLNDTIVIFDRIRENETLMRESKSEVIINASITQSLSRTLMTSLTTLLAVGAIVLFATGSIQLFAVKLVFGIVIGTYSSIFVASPVLHFWRSVAVARRKKREAERYHRGAVNKAQPAEATAAAGGTTAAPSVDTSAVRREIAQQQAKRKRR